MAILEQLRKLNPELPFYSVLDPEFRAYGRVIDFDAASLIETCESRRHAGKRQPVICPTCRSWKRCPSLRT